MRPSRLMAFAVVCLFYVASLQAAEVRKLGEYDLSWGPYGTTWTSPQGKVVRYLPRYFSSDAFSDNLTLYGNDLITRGPWVDVRAFLPTGFVTDGSVDYTTQLTTAYNATPTGGTLRIPINILTTGITVGKSIIIDFMGSGQLTVSGANYGIVLGDNVAVRRNITIKNGKISGTSSGKGGIRVGPDTSILSNTVASVTIKEMEITGFTSASATHNVATGASAINGGAGIFIGSVVNLVLDRNDVRGNYHGMVENAHGNATTADIRSCYFRENTKYGEYLTASRSFSHLAVIWESNGDSGFYAVTPATQNESNLNLSFYGGHAEQNVTTTGTYNFVIGNDNANNVRNTRIFGLTSSLSAAAIAAGKKHLLLDRGREASIYNLYVGDATQTPVTTTNSTSVWIFGISDDAAASVLDSKTMYVPFDATDGSIFGIIGKLRVGSGGSAISKHRWAEATLDFDLSGSSPWQDKTITVTNPGFTMGEKPTCSGVTPPVSGAVTDNMVFTCNPTADNTVTVRGMRTGGTPNPDSGTFRVDVWVH